MDTVAWPLAELLSSCLCDELANDLPGRCCVVAGAEVAHENCCEAGGQASVRIAQIYPSDVFPNPGITNLECPTGGLAVVLEMEVVRCWPSASGARAQAPSCAQLTEAARRIADDARAMFRAVHCCFIPTLDADPPAGAMFGPSVVPGEWTAIGPEGGCAGGRMPVTVSAQFCCPPDNGEGEDGG